MLPQEKVKNLIERHLELEKELSSGEIDKNNFAEISKEYSDLSEIIPHAKEYLNYSKENNDLNNIISDKNSDYEMKEFASSELENLKSQVWLSGVSKDLFENINNQTVFFDMKNIV